MGTESHSEVDIQRLKQGMRSTWMAGDFGVIAQMNTDVAAEFAARLPLPVGAQILDVATGTGNVAIPLAAAGYIVTGVDIASNLLEQGRRRAQAAAVKVQFDEGDAEALPYPDASFDAVVTMFGAMFAPRPALVAAEFARVLRPGGVLAMANWNPESFSGAMFRTGARHVPPPASVLPPMLWGVPGTVVERLQAGFRDIATQLIPIDFALPTPPSGAVDLFRTYFGPTAMAFARLAEGDREAFAADLLDLCSGANVSEQPGTHTLVRNEYLQVVAIRR